MIARHRALPLSMVRASVTKGAAASRQGDYFLAVSFAARQDSDSAAKEWPPAERPIVNGCRSPRQSPILALRPVSLQSLGFAVAQIKHSSMSG
jgi:hypothetical protein